MKIIEKKLDKVVLELTKEEIENIGFDKIWDDIRLIYPASKYEVTESDKNHNGKIIIIILKDIDFFDSILRINSKIVGDDIN